MRQRQLSLDVAPLPRKQAEAMSPAEQRALAREQADDVLEAVYQAEYWLDQVRRRFGGLYRTAFKEESPAFEPSFRERAG